MPINFTQDEPTLNLQGKPTDANGNALDVTSGSWTVSDPSLLRIESMTGPGKTLCQLSHPTRNVTGSCTATFTSEYPPITETINIIAGVPAGGSITKL